MTLQRDELLALLPPVERGTFVRAFALARILDCTEQAVVRELRKLRADGLAERFEQGWRQAAREEEGTDALTPARDNTKTSAVTAGETPLGERSKSTARQGEAASPVAGEGRNPTPVPSTRGTKSSAAAEADARESESVEADPGAPAGPDLDADAGTPAEYSHPEPGPSDDPRRTAPDQDGARDDGRTARRPDPYSAAPAGDTPSGERAPLGERLRAARIAAGLTQRALAETLGLPASGQAQISLLERTGTSTGRIPELCEAWLAEHVEALVALDPAPHGEEQPSPAPHGELQQEAGVPAGGDTSSASPPSSGEVEPAASAGDPGARPVIDLHCPLCDAEVDWTCYGDTGRAHCPNGRHVRRCWGPGETPEPCEWGGTAIRRVSPSDVTWTNPAMVDPEVARRIVAAEAEATKQGLRALAAEAERDEARAEIRAARLALGRAGVPAGEPKMALAQHVEALAALTVEFRTERDALRRALADADAALAAAGEPDAAVTLAERITALRADRDGAEEQSSAIVGALVDIAREHGIPRSSDPVDTMRALGRALRDRATDREAYEASLGAVRAAFGAPPETAASDLARQAACRLSGLGSVLVQWLDGLTPAAREALSAHDRAALLALGAAPSTSSRSTA